MEKETRTYHRTEIKDKNNKSMEVMQLEVRREMEAKQKYKEDLANANKKLEGLVPKKPKTGGRKKGTPNKKPPTSLEKAERILKKHKFDPFEAQVMLAGHLQEEIDRLTKEDKEDKREKKLKTQHLLIQVLRDMLPIIYPKRKEVDLKQDITTQSFQTLTIVTSKTHCVEFALEKAKADAEGREMKTIEIKKEDSGQVDGGSLSVSEEK